MTDLEKQGLRLLRRAAIYLSLPGGRISRDRDTSLCDDILRWSREIEHESLTKMIEKFAEAFTFPPAPAKNYVSQVASRDASAQTSACYVVAENSVGDRCAVIGPFGLWAHAKAYQRKCQDDPALRHLSFGIRSHHVIDKRTIVTSPGDYWDNRPRVNETPPRVDVDNDDEVPSRQALHIGMQALTERIEQVEASVKQFDKNTDSTPENLRAWAEAMMPYIIEELTRRMHRQGYGR